MNDTVLKRICKLIAMNYALKFSVVWSAFERTNSVDTVLELAENETLAKLST